MIVNSHIYLKKTQHLIFQINSTSNIYLKITKHHIYVYKTKHLIYIYKKLNITYMSTKIGISYISKKTKQSRVSLTRIIYCELGISYISNKTKHILNQANHGSHQILDKSLKWQQIYEGKERERRSLPSRRDCRSNP